MTIRKIITIPDSIFRIQVRQVASFSPELQYFTNDTIKTMRITQVVGLADPQVGVDKQIILLEYSEEIKNANSISKAPK